MEPCRNLLGNAWQRAPTRALPTLMLVTALRPRIGYDEAAKLAHTALAQDISLREANERLGFLSAEEFDNLVRPAAMTHP